MCRSTPKGRYPKFHYYRLASVPWLDVRLGPKASRQSKRPSYACASPSSNIERIWWIRIERSGAKGVVHTRPRFNVYVSAGSRMVDNGRMRRTRYYRVVQSERPSLMVAKMRTADGPKPFLRRRITRRAKGPTHQ